MKHIEKLKAENKALQAECRELQAECHVLSIEVERLKRMNREDTKLILELASNAISKY